MHSLLSFVTLALVLSGSAIASPLKRAPTLQVSLSTAAASIQSVDEISLIATVENTSGEDIKVLKYGTVLDNALPTDSFTVTRGNQSIPFTGVKLQLSTTNLGENSFIVIPAGQSVSATHTNIGPLYNFHEGGAGAFTFTPKQQFQVASAEGGANVLGDTVTVSTDVPAVEVFVESDVAKRELSKRAKVVCNIPEKASFISSSYTEGKALAKMAADYIRTRGTGDRLFRSYFGRASNVPASVFAAVANENSGTRTLGCNDPHDVCKPEDGVIAYTVTDTTDIFYCPIFFEEVATPDLCAGTTIEERNIRGGTTLHELTHALSNTDDYIYGCANDRNLASQSPADAINNADNYNCFATEVYRRTKC